MNFPRITSDPYADADAMDRFIQENKCDSLKCDKCRYEIEEGEEYFFIALKGFDDIIICEDCISDFKTTHMEEE